MWQRYILLVVLTVFSLLLMPYLTMALGKVWQLYLYLNDQLYVIFSGSMVGSLIRKTVAIVLIPSVVAGLPSIAYALITGKNVSNYYLCAVWFFWSLTTATIACHQ